MSREFTGSPSDFDLTNALADEVYRKVAIAHAEPVEVVHTRPLCVRASRYFYDEAKKIWTTSVQYREIFQGNYKLSHTHNSINEAWRIDLTWQQFLYPKRARPEDIDPALPKVLIIRQEELAQELSNLGVPKKLHLFWTRASVAYPLPTLGDSVERA